MRVGLGVSIFGHVAILGFGFFAFPEARPFTPEQIEALPVELVQIADETDLLTGDKDAEALPEEAQQPKPVVQAEAPAPEPAEAPVETPVEAAREPVAAAPPPPEPEPEPEPEEVAALPEPPPPEPPPPAETPEPLPPPEPEPPKPVESRVPKARPNPPRQVAEPAPEPPAEPEQDIADLIPRETEQDLESLVQQALLNKQEPTGGGDPLPADEPQTLGSVAGSVTAEMTQSWLAALTFKLANCWTPPIGAREAGALVVTISFNLLPDGSLAGAPVPYQVAGVSNPQAMAATDAALRAVAQCAPYDDIFPPEHYEQWQSILIDFDPSKMLGAG